MFAFSNARVSFLQLTVGFLRRDAYKFTMFSSDAHFGTISVWVVTAGLATGSFTSSLLEVSVTRVRLGWEVSSSSVPSCVGDPEGHELARRTRLCLGELNRCSVCGSAEHTVSGLQTC